MSSMAATKPNISTGRAQDWISTVINPVLASLRRSQGRLEHGPWEIHPNEPPRLETIYKVRDAVLAPYHDNIDDFTRHEPAFVGLFTKYDRAIEELTAAVWKAYTTLRATTPTTSDPDEWKYLTNYAAGNIQHAPSSWSYSAGYNGPLGKELRARIAKEIDASTTVGREAFALSEILVKELIATRERLADTYGARVVPVGDFVLG